MTDEFTKERTTPYRFWLKQRIRLPTYVVTEMLDTIERLQAERAEMVGAMPLCDDCDKKATRDWRDTCREGFVEHRTCDEHTRDGFLDGPARGRDARAGRAGGDAEVCHAAEVGEMTAGGAGPPHPRSVPRSLRKFSKVGSALPLLRILPNDPLGLGPYACALLRVVHRRV